MFNRIAFLDVDSSGLSPFRDRITENSLVLVDGATVVEWSWLEHPGQDVLDRRRLRGSGSDELADAPKCQEIASTFHTAAVGSFLSALMK